MIDVFAQISNQDPSHGTADYYYTPSGVNEKETSFRPEKPLASEMLPPPAPTKAYIRLSWNGFEGLFNCILKHPTSDPSNIKLYKLSKAFEQEPSQFFLDFKHPNTEAEVIDDNGYAFLIVQIDWGYNVGDEQTTKAYMKHCKGSRASMSVSAAEKRRILVEEGITFDEEGIAFEEEKENKSKNEKKKENEKNKKDEEDAARHKGRRDKHRPSISDPGYFPSRAPSWWGRSNAF